MLRFRFSSVALSVLALGSLCILSAPASAQSATFVNTLETSGSATDLNPGSGPNINRLSLYSDLFYDRERNLYYGLPDRGPGGGLVSYDTRVQEFRMDVNPITGAIGNLQLQRTVQFTDPNNLIVSPNSSTAFNGLNPTLLNGNPGILGRSFDPEGFAVSSGGNFYVSDEYGPSVYEFDRNGVLLATFTPPTNLLPRSNAAGNPLNYTATRTSSPALVTGRQDNRGYEGLAVSPDGSRLYAMLQDPLADEGAMNEGRRSRNLRIVEYDTATRQSLRQFIYQLDDLAAINANVPGNTFGATAQGRNIGISSIIPINATQFLVLERDNRGFGVDELVDSNPTAFAPVATKKIYQIDISTATDVSATSLAGTNTLPGGVTPVTKTLFLDLRDSLMGQLVSLGIPVLPEKFEGVTFGPQLSDGTYSLLVGTDNDFSVTQTGTGEQFDIYYTTNAQGQVTATEQVPLGAPTTLVGGKLIPSYLFGFKTTPGAPLGGLVFGTTTAPEPGSAMLVGLGLVAFAGGAVVRRRRK